MLALYGVCVSAACFWLAGRRRRDVAELEGRLSDSDAARIEAERRLHEAGVSAAVSRAQSDGAQVRLREVSEELAKTQHELARVQQDLAACRSQSEILERTNAQTQERYAELRTRLDADFQILANKVFDEARAKFVDQGSQRINSIVEPLSLNLQRFRERVDAVHDAQTRASEGVKVQIENLLKMNERLSEDAENLTAALRGNNKVAGNWGEAVLEKIFQSCGLIKGVHYRAQESFSDPTSVQSRLVPDFIVDLPDSRSIIVDSKVSLLDYVDYCSATDAAAKRESLSKFKKSTRAHLKEFAKKYDCLSGMAGFKLMFIPIEPAYNLIVESDKTLLFDAYADNVIIVSPTSVMAILKYAQIAYRNEAVSKNLGELSKCGRLLCDRINGFLERFSAIQTRIDGLQNAYNASKTALSEGTQSVSKTARRFYELSQKSLEGQNKEIEKELENE